MNLPKDPDLWVPNPISSGVMGSFAWMVAFIAGMNRSITGRVG